MTDSSSDDRPIFMTRLVVDNAGMMIGGLAQVGSLGVTVFRRSATSCRASNRSVPSSNLRSIDDSWETDFEYMTSSPGMP